MKIHTVIVGDLHTNCYIVENNNECVIIDPGDDVKKIVDEIGNLKVKEILVTHHHFDHIGALNELENKYGIKHNSFHSSNFEYEIIKTPGHTDDLLTFYFKEENVMFCGDFIFCGSIGRFDFPESSYEDMINSLNIISEYDNDIKIYPGHGPSTYLGVEKENFKQYI